jgi:Zn-dependent M16 (insulinase) family peptidase
MIQTYLLDNVHKTVIRFKPDTEIAKRFEEEELARLKSTREAMSEDKVQELIENTKQLKLMQETPTLPRRWKPCPYWI